MTSRRSDRPLNRRLIKIGCSLFLGRKRAHWQDCVFGLQLDKNSGNIKYHGKSVGTLNSADFTDLEEISIIGSGPSMLKQDLSEFALGSSILLNGASILAPQIKPAYIAVEDERFVWRHFEMLRSVPLGCRLMLSPGAIRAILEHDPCFLKDRQVTLIDNLLKPVHEARRKVSDPFIAPLLDATSRFSLRPDIGVMPAGTVAFSAMQFAVAAKPSLIKISGVDLTNTELPRFYETADHSAKSGISKGIDRILKGFAAAKNIADSHGIATVCMSPYSALREIGYGIE